MKAFVVCRDRVTYADACVKALLAANLQVHIVDHGSTYPPMRQWLRGSNNPIWQGLQLPRGNSITGAPNRHPRDLWLPDGTIQRVVEPGERFIVTDCDIVPDPGCPADWVDRLAWMLDRLPSAKKVGLSLRTDDLPACYERAPMVREWERQFQAVPDGGVLNFMPGDGAGVMADIDTTLALYRRFEPFALGPAVRLRPPYVARHLAWYEDTANPTPEQMYYRERAAYGHWRAPEGYNDTHHLGG